MWRYLKYVKFQWHLFLAAIIRAILIVYGIYHDEHFSVSYTDVDYKVFTDAARHVLDHNSPYNRHTYRYSPLIAYLLVPNILLHPCFGKVLFCLADLLVAAVIREIVIKSIQNYEQFKASDKSAKKLSFSQVELNKPSLKNIRQRSRKIKRDKFEKNLLTLVNKQKTDAQLQSDCAAMLWLYNPLSIAIATRGNSDSIAGLLVLATLYLLQCKAKCFAAGAVHGISIHFRLYPIIYSLAMFMYLSSYAHCTTNRFANHQKQIKSRKEAKNNGEPERISYERKTIFRKVYLLYLIPNGDQLRLIFGCLLSLGALTSVFYYLYGYTFLFETYIYHFVRQDTRHNFSLFFYLQYLTAGVKNIGIWQKVLIAMPQIILLLVFSVRYGLNKLSLNFSILTQTIAMVTYNTVLTSQYFVWILVVLPLSVWQIKMSLRMSIFFVTIWFAAQVAWLIPAYFLEFEGQNTFMFIWIQSVSFFCANIAILGRLIMNFMPLKRMKTL